MQHFKKIKVIIHAIILLSVGLTMPITAHSTEVLKLRPSIEVIGEVVTLSDIFENVSSHRSTPIFKSPALGREGTVRLEQLIDAAGRHGFTFDTPLNLKTITVSRPARTIPKEQISKLIEKQIASQVQIQKDSQFKLTFSAPLKNMKIPLAYSGELKVTKFKYDHNRKYFSATFTPTEDRDNRYSKTISGRSLTAYRRPVLIRAIKRGDRISAGDIEIKLFPLIRIPKTAISSTNEIIGMTATKTLRNGNFIKASDIETPKLVKKDQLVTLIFEFEGLTLKTQGKAMEDGGLNTSISVLNVQSKRVVHGTIISHGVVVMRSNSPTKLLQKTAQLTK